MSNRVLILPNLRKGLSRMVKAGLKDPDGLRTGFRIDVKITGHSAGEPEGSGYVSVGGDNAPSLSREFYLAGPVDVRGINADAIALTVPADKSKGYSCDYMPYLEFHEEDFPWRYTPLPSSDKLVPWILLLACKEGEYTLQTTPDGSHQVVINLEGAEGEEADTFYPKKEDFHKLAHAQILTPDGEDRIAHLAAHPEDGVSRLFCTRKLLPGTKYTMFLVPAFELGRLAGLGEPLEGQVPLDRLSFEGNPVSIAFPVYYQWSFTSGADKFMDLAKKQQFLAESEFGALSSGLKMDISETGLKKYRVPQNPQDKPVNDQDPIDLPVALVKPGFSEKTLLSEDDLMDWELKNDLLFKNPVFSDGHTQSELYEDPWVVPPVYGARHILAKSFDLSKDNLFLKDLNLKFRNRAAAGMGTSVVRKNQEFFVNRAWGMVEDINKMNQRIREFYQVLKTNGAADAKTTALRKYKFGSSVYGLQADAAIRVAGAQSASDINAIDLATDVTGQALNVMTSSMGEYTRGDGITAEELEAISQESNWRGRKVDITKMGIWYKRITGQKPFFESVDPKFKFVAGITSSNITYPTVTFTPSGDVTVQPAGRHLFTLRQWAFYPLFQPDSFVPYLGFNNSPEVLRWVDNTDALVYDKNTEAMDLIGLRNTLQNAKAEYNRRWADDADSQDFDRLTLPVSVLVRDIPDIDPDNCNKKFHQGDWVDNKKRVYFLRQAVYNRYFSAYPNGVAFELEKDNDVVTTYILPQSSFYDAGKNQYFYYYETDKAGVDILMLKQSVNNKDWFFAAKSDKISPWMQLSGGVRVKRNSDLVYGENRKLLGELVAWPDGLEGIGELSGVKLTGGVTSYMARIKENTDYYYVLTSVAYIPWMWITRYKQKNNKFDRSLNIGIDSNIFWIENDKAKVNWTKLHDLLTDTYVLLNEASDRLWRPNLVLMKSLPKDVPVFDADDMMGVTSATQAKQLIESTYKEFMDQVNKYRVSEYLKDVWETMGKREDMTAKKKDDEEMKSVDADVVNRKRLVDVVKEFGKRGMTVDLMESNFDGKYPIMAAPVFPDPTSFYLRELSERFLLPSVDELKMNSISVFQTNPAFEEAFLAGMNTEMGRELLWREYPTDERGSYFRKFWEQDALPEDFGKGYFDVKYLHKWNHRLGENHEQDKGRMLVFVVKSELMVQYPLTSLFLATVGESGHQKCPQNILYPEMTGWLSDNAFMAGFYPDKLATKSGVYLMFLESDKSQRFNYSTQVADKLSSDFAVNRSDSGSLWGIELAPASLTIK